MECAICYGRIRKKKFWMCPECNNKLHITCYKKWTVYSDACPFCRYSPEDEDKSWKIICCCFFTLALLGYIFGTDQHTN